MTLLTMDEAAERLRKTPRWLGEWLREHPADRWGDGLYREAGRTKLFTEQDVERVREAIVYFAATKAMEPDTREGYIYFIDGGECVKIGYTRSIEHRIKKMLTDAPVELKVLHIEPGTFKQEKIFHREFATLRVRGEWFRKAPELLAFIEQRKRIKAGQS